MRNFIRDGRVVNATAPSGGIASSAGVVIGNLFGVAATTAAEGEAFQLVTHGVFELPKLNTAVLAAGAIVSWDATNKRCDVPASGLYPIGTAIAAAGNGATTVQVRLDGVRTSAAA